MTRGVAIDVVGSGDPVVPTPHPRDRRPQPRPRVPAVVGVAGPSAPVVPPGPLHGPDPAPVATPPAGAPEPRPLPVAVPDQAALATASPESTIEVEAGDLPAAATPTTAAPTTAAPATAAPATATPAPPATDVAAADAPAPGVDPAVAEEFVRLFHTENPTAGPAEPRVAAVREEIARTGTYVHTHAELEFGARVAWRQSARCIGRLYWRSLHLRDRRHVTAPDEVAQECVGHLREATRRGRIRSTITIFAPDGPAGPGPRVWNEQLIRYAGYRAGGRVLGDPRYVGFTDTARSLGWLPPSPMGRFDVLPLVVSGGGEHAAAGPQVCEVPRDAVLEVPLATSGRTSKRPIGLGGSHPSERAVSVKPT